jgi:ribosomal protein S17E
MGRIKGTHIKNLAKEIRERYPSEWSKDFGANKEKLRSMGLEMASKEDQNKLAGELTVEHKKSLLPPRPAYRPREESEPRRMRRDYGRGGYSR